MPNTCFAELIILFIREMGNFQEMNVKSEVKGTKCSSKYMSNDLWIISYQTLLKINTYSIICKRENPIPTCKKIAESKWWWWNELIHLFICELEHSSFSYNKFSISENFKNGCVMPFIQFIIIILSTHFTFSVASYITPGV